jgi:hypothetical protein
MALARSGFVDAEKKFAFSYIGEAWMEKWFGGKLFNDRCL